MSDNKTRSGREALHIAETIDRAMLATGVDMVARQLDRMILGPTGLCVDIGARLLKSRIDTIREERRAAMEKLAPQSPTDAEVLANKAKRAEAEANDA